MSKQWRKTNLLLTSIGVAALPSLIVISCASNIAESEPVPSPEKDVLAANNNFNPMPRLATANVQENQTSQAAWEDIMTEKDEASNMVRNRIYGRYLKEASKNGQNPDAILQADWSSGSFFGQDFQPNSKLLGIEASGVPGIVTEVIAALVNRIWQINFLGEHYLDSTNIIDEFLRLSNSTVLELLPFLNILQNYQNHPGETAKHPEWAAGYSWSNLLHFTRLALAKTPEGVYDHEGLLALLSPLGRIKIMNFNENIARPYAFDPVTNKPTGGYGATKLDLAPRLQNLK